MVRGNDGDWREIGVGSLRLKKETSFERELNKRYWLRCKIHYYPMERQNRTPTVAKK